ncbi:hypothetical protein VIGAN_11158700 [Vigna angularis var. angularis]|uniref:Uncharacterized protein n=1 Tax=Vigna angularis var. angularis TaxID=157739 RepID=A0A0S3TA85_PHAAN|nr:hypothetical protein VIGAN_11158700 [Vigna angularis var. angularis]
MQGSFILQQLLHVPAAPLLGPAAKVASGGGSSNFLSAPSNNFSASTTKGTTIIITFQVSGETKEKGVHGYNGNEDTISVRGRLGEGRRPRV